MKRCPFKTNLNKQYTATFRDSDFQFFFHWDKNEDGTYTAYRGSITPTYEWAVYDTLNMNRQYTDQQKDLVIALVFDGVLQQTLTDELYNEYHIIKNGVYKSSEEIKQISLEYSRKVNEHYAYSLRNVGLRKRTELILNVIYQVMKIHMPDFVYVK